MSNFSSSCIFHYFRYNDILELNVSLPPGLKGKKEEFKRSYEEEYYDTRMP